MELLRVHLGLLRAAMRRNCAAARGATRRSATSSTNCPSQRDEFHQVGRSAMSFTRGQQG
jgi:hypothetical protein